ncbi:MAG: hypothetical protein LBL45_09150 [Treponema sp.]|jgi:hypothetical protein|nr:hypothetical protein [Treponema sp.]
MALHVVKKVFSGLDAALEDVAEFLSDTWRNGQTVEVRLYASGRLKKRDAREALRKAFKERPCDWEHGEYNFLFNPEALWHRFFWRGKPMRVTKAESLFLFRRLVLGKDSDKYALHNIRRRLGGDFLKDAELVENMPPAHNVGCAFPDGHERNRGKPSSDLIGERRGYRLI